MAHENTLRLLACQIDVPATPDIRTRNEHLASTAEKLRKELTKEQVDLVVLPELSSIDYSREAFDQLDEIAEPLDGMSFQTWREVATEFGVHVCYGFARKDAAGTYISIAVVTPDGTLSGHYDKLHICQYGASMEKEYFAAGRGIFTFDVQGFTVAPVICYDIRFPELTRVLTQGHGVDLLLHCVANYRDESFRSWHDFVVTRAMENQVYLLSINRAGAQWGGSIFCRPWMDDTHRPDLLSEATEEFRVLTADKKEIDHARTSYTFLDDRLDNYEALPDLRIT